MPLKFPNARLFLHELLSGQRLSGAEAIARGACQFGLITSDTVIDALPTSGDYQCRCIPAARDVLRKHFEQRPPESSLPEVDHETVWSAIENHIKSHPHAAGGGLSFFRDGSDEGCEGFSSACHQHAPVLFDVMLQQLMRYP